MTPRSFGKYLLDREIARGGMARVHLARLRGLGGFEKRLVLKEIDPALARDPRFVELFVAEANTLVQMSHPGIVPVYELGVVEGTYFLAMEHVRGVTLEALVAERPLEPAEVAHVGAQVADALAYAHEQFSLVHRDVTPRNVMIDAHGHARLLDFGIAARLDEGDGDEAVFGTPGYLSPEQARGERLSAASDLFGLGAVLHRAATGEHAFDASLDAIRSLSTPPRLAALDALPQELSRIVRAALHPDPSQRPASGKQMGAQLRAFLASERPEGVADTLGARAERLARSHETDPDAPGDERLETPPATGRTQSLATSPALDALLGTPPAWPPETQPSLSGTTPLRERQRAASRTDGPGSSTERLARAAAQPEPTPSETPERERTGARLSWPAIAALTAALAAASMWALSFARFEAPTEALVPNPLDPTPLEIEPPDASVDAGPGPNAVLDARDNGASQAISDTGPEEGPSTPEQARSTAPRGATARRAPGAPPSRTGTLTVSAVPWADVWVDGALLGRTPLRGRPLPPGVHALELRCPPLGRTLTREVRVREDESTRVSANFQVSPATLSEQ
jgi:serine/threonine protein kinase